MKRKRIKKYNTGGMTLPTNFQAGAGFSGTATGQGIGMFGGMAGNAIAQADQADGHMSTGGALGSGALKGAAMGAALGPLGMLIGGGIGAVGGLIQKKKFNEDQREADRLQREQEREQNRLQRAAELQAMDAALEQYPVTGNATPRFDKGGDTKIDVKGNMTKAMSRKDGVMENILEFVDPSGITSWDDAYRAYNSMKASGRAVPNFEEFVDMLGAVPLVGKVGKGAKVASTALKTVKSASQGARAASAAGKLMNAVDTGQDIYSDNIKNSTGRSKTKEPRFNMGGDTNPPAISGGEQYFAMPNYGGSMDPNAQPSMDFYYGGQKMPAQEFIQHLPEGVNINDVAQYGYAKSKPRYNPQDGWSYTGQNNYMTDFRGMMDQPTYAYGGDTPGGGKDPYAALDNSTRAKLRASKLHPQAMGMIDQYPKFATALGEMPHEQFQDFETKTAALVKQAQALKGQGAGAALDFARNMDISYVQPLREKAGWSKSDVLDEVLGKTDLGYLGRKAAKTAMMMKDFAHGGDTHGGDTPKFFNAAPTPNMPMGRELRHERGMPYYMPVDSPNGSIRQWEPGMMDYLRESFANTMNPSRAIADADYMQRTDNYNHKGGLMMQAGLNKRDALYSNNKHDILPDWAYGLAGVGKKAMGGMTGGPNYEVEGGEMMQYKGGDRPATYGQGGLSQVSSQEFEVKGPKHSQGGVKASDNKGARVYSDQLRVDKSLAAKLMKL